MGVDVRAAVIGPWRLGVVMIVCGLDVLVANGVLADAGVHVLMRKGMRFGKLWSMQDRQIAAAQQGDHEHRRNHGIFDKLAHGLSKAVRGGCVKSRARDQDLRAEPAVF